MRTLVACAMFVVFLRGRLEAQEPLAERGPLQITITGPTACYIDESVIFQVNVRNIGDKPHAKTSFKVGTLFYVRYDKPIKVFTEVAITLPGGKIISWTTSKIELVPCEEAATGQRAVSDSIIFKVLAPGETQTLPLKVNFKQPGISRFIVEEFESSPDKTSSWGWSGYINTSTKPKTLEKSP